MKTNNIKLSKAIVLATTKELGRLLLRKNLKALEQKRRNELAFLLSK
jgi:hypothetical protein